MNQRHEPEPPLPELDALARELPPPPDLEARVIGALRDRSLVRPPHARWRTAAAAVLLLGAGVLIGRTTVAPADRAPGVDMPRFLFMLTDAPPANDDAARAEEYRLWAVEQRAAGRQVSGERLASTGIAVTRRGSAAMPAPEVQGYFVVTATNIDEAVAVARSSPHVQSGGLILVRPIDTPRGMQP